MKKREPLAGKFVDPNGLDGDTVSLEMRNRFINVGHLERQMAQTAGLRITRRGGGLANENSSI